MHGGHHTQQHEPPPQLHCVGACRRACTCMCVHMCSCPLRRTLSSEACRSRSTRYDAHASTSSSDCSSKASSPSPVPAPAPAPASPPLLPEPPCKARSAPGERGVLPGPANWCCCSSSAGCVCMWARCVLGCIVQSRGAGMSYSPCLSTSVPSCTHASLLPPSMHAFQQACRRPGSPSEGWPWGEGLWAAMTHSLATTRILARTHARTSASHLPHRRTGRLAARARAGRGACAWGSAPA